MPPQRQQILFLIISSLQLVALIGGIAAGFVYMGRRDAMIDYSMRDLETLKSIVQDLTKAQVVSVSNDSFYSTTLVEIKSRLTKLEDKQAMR